MSVKSLDVISNTIRLLKFNVGKDPLILFPQIDAISSYFIPRIGYIDSTWFYLKNNYFTPLNCSSKSIFFILFSQRLSILICFFFSTELKNDISGKFLDVSYKQLACVLFASAIVFYICLLPRQFSICYSDSTISTINADLDY